MENNNILNIEPLIKNFFLIVILIYLIIIQESMKTDKHIHIFVIFIKKITIKEKG